MITVYDFIDLCIDNGQIYELYDNATEAVIWKGTIDQLPDEYEYLEVNSFDSIPYGIESLKTGYYQTITLNVDTEK